MIRNCGNKTKYLYIAQNNKETKNMAKQVFDIQPASGMTTAQSNEHQRRWNDDSWDHYQRIGNYDRTRADLNFEIRDGEVQSIDQSRSIPQMMAANLRRRGIKDPNVEKKKRGLKPNARTMVNIIIGGSRDQMRKLAFGDQQIKEGKGADNSSLTRKTDIEEWAKDMYKYVADRFGEKNIVGFYVHLDELNPHIHCSLMPINEKGRFSYNSVFGKNREEVGKTFREIGNELAVINRKWGLDRGDDIRETGARHVSTEEYCRGVQHIARELEEEYASLALRERNAAKDIDRGSKKIKALATMISHLENKSAELLWKLARLEEDYEPDDEQAAEFADRLREKLMAVEAKLEDKRDKYEAALKENDKTWNLVKATREITDEYRSMIEGIAPKAHKVAMDRAIYSSAANDTEFFENHVHDVALNDFGDDPELGHEILRGLETEGSNLQDVARMLFLGYVNAAMSIAGGGSGGGSGPTGGWGKKNDEDERAWVRRCLIEAARMSRPRKKGIRR